MKAIFLDLPNEHAERVAWLERRLVSDDLADLVNELLAIQSRAPSASAAQAPSLDVALSGFITAVYENGLAALGERELGLLIRHPVLLLELRGRVLMEGGLYWDALLREETKQDFVDRQWRSLSERLDDAHEDDDAPIVELAATESPSRRRMPLWVVGSLIAALLLVAAAAFLTRPEEKGWGFDRSGLLAAEVSGPEYLRSLANAGGAWFNKRPVERDQVAKRLREFIRGCDALIAAPHEQLASADRQWLIERCGAWKASLNRLLADLDAGSASPKATRDAADEVVRKLQQALRDRAEAAA